MNKYYPFSRSVIFALVITLGFTGLLMWVMLSRKSASVSQPTCEKPSGKFVFVCVIIVMIMTLLVRLLRLFIIAVFLVMIMIEMVMVMQ